MLIQETWLDKEDNCIIGETEPYEPYTDNIGDLFRSLQREYGKCVSKMYVDTASNEAAQIGWIFQKRVKYEDSNNTYLQETWVSLHNSMPVRSIQYDYYHLKEVKHEL